MGQFVAALRASTQAWKIPSRYNFIFKEIYVVYCSALLVVVAGH